jgi:hypothetical protein
MLHRLTGAFRFNEKVVGLTEMPLLTRWRRSCESAKIAVMCIARKVAGASEATLRKGSR